MTTTCKTCKYKGSEPSDKSNLKDIKYPCYAEPPHSSVILVPHHGQVEMAHVNSYPQVNNDTPSCRFYCENDNKL